MRDKSSYMLQLFSENEDCITSCIYLIKEWCSNSSTRRCLLFVYRTSVYLSFQFWVAYATGSLFYLCKKVFPLSFLFFSSLCYKHCSNRYVEIVKQLISHCLFHLHYCNRVQNSCKGESLPPSGLVPMTSGFKVRCSTEWAKGISR